MWFLLSSTYMLYFLVFLFFCDDFTNWEYCCESAIIYSMNGKPPVPFNRSLPLHEPWCIYPNNMCFFKIVVNGFQVAGKHNFISLSHAPIFIYKRCRTGKAYRWRGAPNPCACWYMYLQTSSQANIVSRPHTLPMSVWYDFHWHHLLRNRCMKPSVVAMQKTVPLCCDLYQMHHVCTCGLATGDTVCWS